MSTLYLCLWHDVVNMKLYENHSGATDHAEAVLNTIIIRSIKHFILVFPYWMWHFIYGILLSPIGFILRNEKERIFIDPSSHAHDDHDSGPLNNHIDKRNLVDVPSTYYATVQHFIRNPWREILLYKDNINSAFFIILNYPSR